MIAIAIGGVAIGITSLSPRMASQARRRYAAFLTTRPPALVIDAGRDAGAKHEPDASAEVHRTGPRAFSVRYGALEAELDLAVGRGTARVPRSIHVLDSLLRIAMTLVLVEHDALLLHGAGIMWDDGAHVYFGPSGVGKTTIARSVPSTSVLSDEIVALFVDAKGEVLVAGTPFHGELDATSPRVERATAIVRLHQSAEERLERLGDAAAISALLGSTLFFSADDEHAEQLLALSTRVCCGRTYALGFLRSTHAPRFVARALESSGSAGPITPLQGRAASREADPR